MFSVFLSKLSVPMPDRYFDKASSSVSIIPNKSKSKDFRWPNCNANEVPRPVANLKMKEFAATSSEVPVLGYRLPGSITKKLFFRNI